MDRSTDSPATVLRFACDTGGTFTDLVVERSDGALQIFKSSTTPDNPSEGIVDALRLAAEAEGQSLSEYLARGESLIHGTTHAINAIITGNTARTAFLTSEGHPDILVIREAGRTEPFNNAVRYPEPYIPRALTWEVPGRIDAQGTELQPLDEARLRAVIAELKDQGVEAVSVCLLWSIINPSHELLLAELLDELMPGIPYTLSHRLNPSIREYRRASSTAIDASLKPLMVRYLAKLEGRLRDEGFAGRLLVLTSQGGMMDAERLAQEPIHAINSGPSMAPIAGAALAAQEADSTTVIIADTGGTTYDVSLVRDGSIPVTREMWIGEPFLGHMTGFPSVDVKSVGAGGGSIAWVDDGGLLHVGPQSAGAQPGPVCYRRGGTRPTMTDACLTLGYLDPDNFLGGRLQLDASGARAAIDRDVAGPLGISVEDAAAAIMNLATENMVQAIADITINQGIDPRRATLVGGGGAAGLNSVLIASRLGCVDLILPATGPVFSASGALLSDMSSDFQKMHHSVTDVFDEAGVAATIRALAGRAADFISAQGDRIFGQSISYSVEARYFNQAWEIETAVMADPETGEIDLESFVAAFHRNHEELFSFRDEESPIECITWIARARVQVTEPRQTRIVSGEPRSEASSRKVYFKGKGWLDIPVLPIGALEFDAKKSGPAIIDCEYTTVLVNPGASFRKSPHGNLLVDTTAVFDQI